MTDEEAQRLLADLLDQSSMVNGKRVLASGAVRNVAKKFKLSERSVRRQWKKALDRREKEGFYSCTSLKQGNSGRKQLYNREELMEAMEQVPGHERGNLRSLANSLGVGLKTVWMLKMDEKIIHPHTNAIKPFLTDENKLHRIAYAADHVITVNGGSFYDGMYNEIHVDEKWFFISKETQRVYLTQREKRNGDYPKRKCKSKRYLIKVMFLCAVARPRMNEDGEVIFDGMIGCWPFVERVRAQRSSVNRPAGTWETKCKSVTKQEYIKMIVEKVIPAAIAKWPRDRSTREQTI